MLFGLLTIIFTIYKCMHSGKIYVKQVQLLLTRYLWDKTITGTVYITKRLTTNTVMQPVSDIVHSHTLEITEWVETISSYSHNWTSKNKLVTITELTFQNFKNSSFTKSISFNCRNQFVQQFFTTISLPKHNKDIFFKLKNIFI